MKAPFEWSDEWLATFRDICRERWGFRFAGGDARSLEALVERAYLASTALSLAGFASLIATAPDEAPEVQAFVGQIAVGETSFFRNASQFVALAESVLPEIVARRRAEGERTLRIWSAGCSTGEEPYSIAIVVSRIIPDWQAWHVEILATDVNVFALRRASLAVYSDWSFRDLEPDALAPYFVARGKTRRLVHECKSLVNFRYLNLATARIPDPAAGLGSFDVIFCRNVTIYFEPELTARLAASFREALRSGGSLFVGSTEPDPGVFVGFDVREFPDAIVYCRSDDRAGLSQAPSSRPVHNPDTRIAEVGTAPALDVRPALAAYFDGDADSASVLLLDLERSAVDDPRPAHLLAQIAADQREFDEALYWGYSALHRDPFHVPTLLLFGLVHLELGKSADADSYFRKAVFLAPTWPETHYYLSIAQRALGNEPLASRSRDRAARLSLAAIEEEELLPVQRARTALRAS